MDPAELIREAKAGGETVRGSLFDQYRNYLRLLARVEIGRRLRGKLDESDLVQETMMEAHRHFDDFRGTEEPQFVYWLRQILAAKVSNLVRHYFGTQRRDIRLERELEEDLGNSSRLMGQGLVDSLTSPSEQVARREQGVILADALEQLRPEYRDVIILRHLEELTFPEVAKRMGRTQDSVEKLWVRALARLRQVLAPPP